MVIALKRQQHTGVGLHEDLSDHAQDKGAYEIQVLGDGRLHDFANVRLREQTGRSESRDAGTEGSLFLCRAGVFRWRLDVPGKQADDM
jgi:hypothetical protein